MCVRAKASNTERPACVYYLLLLFIFFIIINSRIYRYNYYLNMLPVINVYLHLLKYVFLNIMTVLKNVPECKRLSSNVEYNCAEP